MARQTNRSPKMVDGGAVWVAAFVAGFVFLLVACFILPSYIGGNAHVMIRLFASLILGQGVLAPPATFSLKALLIGCWAHFGLSLGFTALLAIITHRWGLITGIILGAFFGLALYAINVYTLTAIFPWFLILKHPAFLWTNVLFGAVAGGVYELLDDDDPVPGGAR